MRIHEVFLLDILLGLRAWEGLPPEVRIAWCERANHGNTPRGHYGDCEPDMLQDGLLEETPTGLRRIPKTARPLRTVLRAAQRCLVHRPNVEAYLTEEAAERGSLVNYIKTTFQPAERMALLADHAVRRWDLAVLLAERVTSRIWMQPLLSEDAYVDWERRRMSSAWHTPATWTPLLDPPVQRALVQIVDELADAGGTLPVLALFDETSKAEARNRAIALQAGLRYLALFPGLPAEEDPILAVGLLPHVSHAVLREPEKTPEPIRVDVEPSPTFLVSDVTSVLLDAARGDLRVKANEYELYVKSEERLMDALLALPPIVERLGDTDARHRVHMAVTHARELRFIEQDVVSSGRRVLRLTGEGRAWLSGDAKSRLRRIVDSLSGVEQEASDGRVHVWSFPAAARLAPVLGAFYNDLEGFTDHGLLDAIRSAIGRLPTEGAVGLGQWLRREVRDENPLLSANHVSQLRARRQGNSWISPERLERAWMNIIASVVAARLIPLGGLAIARPQRGVEEPFVSLTDIGRYMIGRADDFDLDGPGPSEAKILVQPNFDIVFMSPSPGTEALLVEFAKRVGHQVGTLFHLTREAAMQAAGAGLTVETAIERLEAAQGGAIPENVERSLRDWFGRVRVAQVAQVLVVTCPDEATAARVEAAGGAQTKRLGARLVQLESAAVLKRIEKKLAKEGVLLERSGEIQEARRPPRRPPRRRRRSRW